MNAKIDVTGVELKTQRLTLRPFTYDDLEDFFEYASVDGVGQMAGWLPHENRETSMNILNQFVEGRKTFAIVLEGKVIGSVGIEQYDESELPELDNIPARELGFVLGKPYWGRGYMTELIKEVIRWCFEDIGLEAIVCGHFRSNARSGRVQEKCGFKYIKDHIYRTYYGAEHPAVISMLTKHDYENMKTEVNA